jgi:uncharacterized membrane protein YhaH (DUF805 family)
LSGPARTRKFHRKVMPMAVRPTQLARFWWTFAAPVSRRDYARHGVGLVALKYGGDVALVALAVGRVWTPADYAHSIPFLLATRLEGAPPWLMPALALWTLPFLWAGVTLTMRRALDAGWSAWLALGFFVPYLNHLLMLALCLAPARAAGRAPVPRAHEHRLPSALLAIGAGLAVGLLMMVLAVSALERYGVALFFGTPFGIGALTAFLFNRRYPASARETAEVAAMTLALIAGTAFLLGNEGAICLLMALPISLVVGLMGAAFGRGIALHGRSELGPAGLALCALPLAAALEPSGATGRTLHEVRSAIEIDAPPGVVWSEVIAFPPLPAPDELTFRLGIAYPRSARIEGTGVGATRYCVFSTGAFVEPITAWEPGRRLAFDVTRSPPPLRELTPYAHVTPPHLDGYLAARRGEFRLIPLPSGGTRLEGSTWYRLRMGPEGYWQLYGDYFIHRIHARVLEHIRQLSEARADTR